VTNAVRCAPPQHKLQTSEIHNCRPFLGEEIAAMKTLRVFLSIGREPHEGILRVFGLKTSAYKFAHGAMHELPNGLVLADSFHTSQYNVNTGRLTAAMFTEVAERIKAMLA
jgi:uracil-DNA glycosylase